MVVIAVHAYILIAPATATLVAMSLVAVFALFVVVATIYECVHVIEA